MTGGLFFFDEINRVPERALSPLASVLDSRASVYSATTGLHLSALTPDARSKFRFCCALNPQLSDAGRGVLPEYIEERTLPAIPVDYLPFADINHILLENLAVSSEEMNQFESWYKRKSERQLSVRQALTIMRYAGNLQMARTNLTVHDALVEVEPMVLRPEERGARNENSTTSDEHESGNGRNLTDENGQKRENGAAAESDGGE
jgi:MoxR-like ATPase